MTTRRRPDPDKEPKFYAAQRAMDDVDARLRWQDPRYSFSRYLPDLADRVGDDRPR